MTYHALISPQGHVEYNAGFVVGESNLAKLTRGRWYTRHDLDELCGGQAFLLGDSSQAIEKNINKWRHEVQQ